MKRKDQKEWEVEEAENTFLWIKNYIFSIEIILLIAMGLNLKYFFSNSSYDLIIAAMLVVSALSIFLFYFLYLAIVFRGQILETDLQISFDYSYKPIFYISTTVLTFVLMIVNLEFKIV